MGTETQERDASLSATTPPAASATAPAPGRQTLVHVLRPADKAAMLLVLLHLLPVWWLVDGGGLYLDDLRAQAYARNQPFWSFIMSSNGTHLAPFPRTLDWLQATYLPLEHGPAVTVTLVVHLCLGLAGWLVLRELVGPRPAAVCALAILLLAPSVVSATAWYRQTLTTLTTITLVLAAQYAVLRCIRSSSWRWALGTVALLAVAMTFSERALAGCALVVTTALVVPGPGWRQRWPRVVLVTAVLSALAAVYVAIYRSGPFDQGETGGLAAADFGRLVARSVGAGLVPAVFGGPWDWSPSGPALSIANPPVVLVIVANAAVAIELLRRLLDAQTRRAALAGMAMAASYILPIEAFVFVGRYAGFGSVTGADLRLFADCGIVLTVSLALAFLGWRPADSTEMSSSRADARRLESTELRRNRAAAAVLALAVVVGGTLSWARFGDRWHTNQTTAYVEAMRGDLNRLTKFADETTTVLPGSIPDAVIPAWMQEEISTLDLVALLRPQTELAVGRSQTKLVGPEGRLETGRVRTVGSFDPGEDNFCHHVQRGGDPDPLTIDADTVVDYKRDELIQLGLLVNDEREVVVDIIDDGGAAHRLAWPEPRTLSRGPYTVRLRVPYGVSISAVRFAPSAVGMCVASVSAVTPERS